METWCRENYIDNLKKNYQFWCYIGKKYYNLKKLKYVYSSLYYKKTIGCVQTVLAANKLIIYHEKVT